MSTFNTAAAVGLCIGSAVVGALLFQSYLGFLSRRQKQSNTDETGNRPEPRTRTQERACNEVRAIQQRHHMQTLARFMSGLSRDLDLPINLYYEAAMKVDPDSVQVSSASGCTSLDPRETWSNRRTHTAVCAVVRARATNAKSSKRRDWLFKTSAYQYGLKEHPNRKIKAEVNRCFAEAVRTARRECRELHGKSKMARSHGLNLSSTEVVVVLDAPTFGTTRALAAACGDHVLSCQHIICPQVDLAQYFEMVSNRSVSVNVRLQRLDHWLCTNRDSGIKIAAAFFDYECRVLGNAQEALCPMADIMRCKRLNNFRHFMYPMVPPHVLLFCLWISI